MANCFTFAKTKSIVGEDSTWTSQVVSQSPINFTNAEDSLNETYATAVDENETQYLSVLESTRDETLEEIDITLSNQKLLMQDTIGLSVETESQNNFNLTQDDGNQVVIFNVEGSNELYGIQVAQDNDGNVHRYQFQLRKTGDGQLEPMPETVQLLANDEDQQVVEEQQETEVELPMYLQETEQTDDRSESQVFSKQEVEEDLFSDALDENYDEDSIDIKPGIDFERLKEEFIQQEGEGCENTGLSHDEEPAADNFEEDFTSEANSYDAADIPNTDEAVIEYENFDQQTAEEHYENSTESQDAPLHFEQLFIQDNSDHIHQYNKNLQQDDEDNSNILIIEKEDEAIEAAHEDFEIVSHLPVTAEEDLNEVTGVHEQTEVWYSQPEIPIEPVKLSEKSLLKTTNILKQPMNVNKNNQPKKKTVLYYMVPNTDQKENVNSHPFMNAANPRSLLKTNLDINKVNEDNLKVLQREKVLERRYARSKEAIQAKMFNNFINKTTIPHAPVRQGRLPRKQQITPVDNRRNEEIIVQEVMVSSKGFVENISERLKDIEVTSIVELSDTDEENDQSNGTKKKKKHKRTKSNGTATTSDSEASVIEIIHSDDESDNMSSVVNTVKKGPGKPTKNPEDNSKRTHEFETKSGSSSDSTPTKKSRTDDSSDVESDTNRKEITCPHCPKTFPNQNSLSTHILHHNLENSLRGNKKHTLEYRHKCEECQQTFKNSILLKKHVCSKSKDLKTHKCGVCSKTFKDITVFNIHKRSHVKENLIKNTSTISISPKKFTPRLSRPSTSLFKAPHKPPTSYKCNECSKTCSSQSILTIHEKSHKKFICSNCNTCFASKILLDTHVRIKCVKNASPKNRRLSFKIKKSFISSPRRASIRGPSLNLLKSTAATHTSNTTRKTLAPHSSARKSIFPTNSTRKSVVPSSNSTSSSTRKSCIPNLSTKKNIPSSSARKSVFSGSSSARKSCFPSATPSNSCLGINGSSRTKLILDPLFKDSGSSTKNVNAGLNTSNFVKNLEVEIQCDSCTMKFSNWTALFKHKVKMHGLHTPDKRVLEPKRKALYKPLNVHGGIPANERLSKAFQEIRRTLALNKTEPLKESNAEKDTEQQSQNDIQIVISETSQNEH